MSRDIFSCLKWVRVGGVGLQYQLPTTKYPISNVNKESMLRNPVVGTYFF